MFMNGQVYSHAYALFKIKIRGVSETVILEKPALGRKKKVLNPCSVKIALCHLLWRMSCCKYSSRNRNEDHSLTMHKGPKIQQ